MKSTEAKDAAIVDVAVRDLIEGRRITYITSRPPRVKAILERVVAAAPPELITKVCYGAGGESIQASNGALLTFRAADRPGRGFVADVLLLDEVSLPVAQDAAVSLVGSSVSEIHSWDSPQVSEALRNATVRDQE